MCALVCALSALYNFAHVFLSSPVPFLARLAYLPVGYILCQCFFSFIFDGPSVGAKLSHNIPDRSSPNFQE